MLELEQDSVDITLFVACYNEEANIAGTLDEVFAALEEVGLSHDVIVVDDASRDASVAVIEQYIADHPGLALRLVKRAENVGLAQNFVDAAFLGCGKYYRLICGDNVESRTTLASLFRNVGKADLLITYHARPLEGRTFYRHAISWLFTFLVNTISGYRFRYYNGMAIYRRYDVLRWHTYSNGFGFQADLTTRLLDRGVTYAEVPVIACDRDAETSTALTMRNFLSVGHTLCEIAVRRLAKALYGRGMKPPVRVELPSTLPSTLPDDKP